MNAVPRFLAAMALLLMAGGLAIGAPAAPAPPRAVAHRSTSRPRVTISMDQAVRRAERRYRARVVRAETLTEGDRTIYVLRMLDGSGRVFSVQVDATSGTIL